MATPTQLNITLNRRSKPTENSFFKLSIRTSSKNAIAFVAMLEKAVSILGSNRLEDWTA
jgi:hypothetical protein